MSHPSKGKASTRPPTERTPLVTSRIPSSDEESNADSDSDMKGPTFSRNELVKDVHAAAGEFIGTVLFLLFSLGTVQATVTNLSQDSTSEGTAITGTDAARIFGVYYISCGFGFALFGIASIFYRFTGSIFNPQISLALCLIGAIKPVRCVMVIFAQFLASIAASAILVGVLPGPLSVSPTLGYGTNRTQGLFIEMFATAGLVLSVLMTAAEKSKLTPFAPAFFGVTLFVLELFSVEFTGGALNTARAFGPCVFSGFKPYHWIYWVGPTLGSLLATGTYFFMKWIKYWEINPGQDSENPNDSPSNDVAGNDSRVRLNGRDSTMESGRNSTTLNDMHH